MSDNEFNNISDKIQRGLDKAFIEMLKLKAALGQNVIITDDDGNPIEVSAESVLKQYI